METDMQLDVHGVPLSEDLRQRIRAHVASLEKRFGRITACRITVDAPSGHHITGGQYAVRVHLALPDKHDVTIDRKPDADERFADLAFAVNDAFKRARRRLNDKVRRMQGEIKTHAR